MNEQYAEKAIPLVTVKDGQYNINSEALEIIRSLEGPLVIVGVAGMYRTGKSYLLNRVILNKDKGFGIGSSVNACTKGIWMWAKPLKTQTKSGKLASVIVLDSEGLGAIDQDSAHDCRIFALVLLLTSVFVFNSVGAIDENAISNLSLVINLTKHIETSSRSKTDGSIDYDELHKYFPGFMWVLRDFSLQLKDAYGADITPMEYLENALQEQTGISDEVEQKNRIRRLVKNFFRERNCFTLVRPTTEEEGLQELEKMNFEQLRPEFVEQALELRKALFTIEKFKTFRGQVVNGTILGGIIENYVSTINAGAVPNLEDTWIYICKNHNKKLLAQCQRDFDAIMTNKVKSNIPMSDIYITEIYKEAKDEVTQSFESKSLGEDKKPYMDALASHCKDSKNSLFEDNDRDFELLLYNEMSSIYNEAIFKKAMGKGYKTLPVYVEDLKKFVDSFMSSNIDGPLKAERVYRFALAKGLEGVELVGQHVEAEYQDKYHQKEASTLKLINDYETQLSDRDDKLTSIKAMASELENKMYEKEIQFKDLSEKNLRLKTQLEESNARFNNLMKEDKDKHQVRVKDLQAQLASIESQLSQQNKVARDEQSRLETEIALLENKLSYLSNVEKENKELRERNLKRHQELEDEYKAKISSIIKDNDTRVSEAQSHIRKLNEQKSFYEDEINKKYVLNESIQIDFTKRESEYRSFIGQSEVTITELKNQLSQAFGEKKQLSERESQTREEIAQLQMTLKDSEQILKQREDELQMLRIKLEKESALVQQNKEFYEIRLKEMQEENTELKKVKDVTINSFQSKSISKTELHRQLQEFKNTHDSLILALKEDHALEVKEVKDRYVAMIENEEGYMAELKKKKEELLIQCQELQHQLSSADSERLKLGEQLRVAEESKTATLNELKIIYDRRIKELELEVEALGASKEEDVESASKSMEERIRKLREIYEKDKAKLEQKIIDEKQKVQRQIEEVRTELEDKAIAELSGKDDEIEALRDQLEDAEMQINQLQCLIDEERAAASERISEIKRTHETEKKESKENFERDLQKLKRDLDIKDKEREEQIKSNSNTRALLHEKETIIHNMERDADRLAEILARDIGDRDKLISDLSAAKETLESKLEKIQTERNSLSEELIDLRMKLSKETALAQQRGEFDRKKITDLETALSAMESVSDISLRKLRSEHEEEVNSLKAYISEREEELNTEIDEKSKALKDMETLTTLTITELEKTNQLLADKVTFAETRKAELETKYKGELETATQELKKLRESQTVDRKALMEDMNGLRKEKYELEISLAEIQARADKDKAVFEGRVQFLEQQNKKLKSDLNENQHNFDLMFQKLHQFRQADKEEIETSHNALIYSLEERYNNKINELKAKNKQEIDFLKEKVKTQDKEIKRLTMQKQEILDQRFGNGIIHEKRISDLLESDKVLQQEVAVLKAERDNMTVSFQVELEKHKDTIKKKFTEIEQRYKKCEAEKNHISYEQEKLKARWQIEKDNLITQHTDALEAIDKLQKQKDSLSKELEKVRQDFKNLRKSTLNASSFGFSKKKVTQYFANKGKKDNDIPDSILSEMN